MKGQNTYKWLIISSTELCQKRCLWDFCQVHRARLRKSTGTKPCTACGVGVKNKYLLSQTVGMRRHFSMTGRKDAKPFKRNLSVLRPSKFHIRDKIYY